MRNCPLFVRQKIYQIIQSNVIVVGRDFVFKVFLTFH